MRIEPSYYDKQNGIILYQGDSVDILEKLSEKLEGKMNCVITDSPYGIKYVSNHRTHGDILGEAIKNDEDLTVVEKVLPNLNRVLRTNSALYFFAHPNMIGDVRKIIDPFFTYKNTIVWDKGDAGTFGDLEAGYSLNWEAVIYYNKGRRFLNGARPRAIARYSVESTEERPLSDIPRKEMLDVVKKLIYNLPEEKLETLRGAIPDDILNKAMRDYPKAKIRFDWSSRTDPVHPTSKPVYLMRRFIEASTNPGDWIIDPFCGTAPVGAAAKQLGRRFIGIELRPEFLNIAITRLHKTDAVAQRTAINEVATA